MATKVGATWSVEMENEKINFARQKLILLLAVPYGIISLNSETFVVQQLRKETLTLYMYTLMYVPVKIILSMQSLFYF